MGNVNSGRGRSYYTRNMTRNLCARCKGTIEGFYSDGKIFGDRQHHVVIAHRNPQTMFFEHVNCRMKAIVKVTRSSKMERDAWDVILECGHKFWVAGDKPQRGAKMKCQDCEREKK